MVGGMEVGGEKGAGCEERQRQERSNRVRKAGAGVAEERIENIEQERERLEREERW